MYNNLREYLTAEFKDFSDIELYSEYLRYVSKTLKLSAFCSDDDLKLNYSIIEILKEICISRGIEVLVTL